MTIARPFAALSLASAVALATVPALAVQDASPQLPGQMDVTRVAAGTYATDPAHTLVGWRVNHFGFNDYFGSFGDAEGTLTIDPADPSSATVDVTVPITSVSVVSEGLRDHLLRPGANGGDPDFFGPDPAPARFVSDSVAVHEDGTSATVSGQLTMNGITRPVSMDVQFTGAGAHPRSGVETIGFEGTTEIRRSEFGIDTAIPLVSDEVELTISAAFEKQ
ncbi:YceI family protein [Qipengyuania sp. MTN3-11]|uniref:YceI family protein n=1 Tax=Qipengyuania sp. MTN3-11 TaxID=3056557 RepID=UPI0036F3F789